MNKSELIFNLVFMILAALAIYYLVKHPDSLQTTKGEFCQNHSLEVDYSERNCINITSGESFEIGQTQRGYVYFINRTK